jgi:hypothetical protein
LEGWRVGGLEGWRVGSPGDIVAHKAETGDARVRLHDSSQRRLGILSHRVGFVQDDEFVWWAGVFLAIPKASGISLVRQAGTPSVNDDE